MYALHFGFLLSHMIHRISKLEFLDEIEELDLVLSHYAVSWGLYLTNPSLATVWGSWGLIRREEE